jgi:geranylgeranyl pyrophosphate synthase
LVEALIEFIGSQIEAIWLASGAGPDFIHLMRQALVSGQAKSEETGQILPRWVSLPILSCQAAGGEAHFAFPLAAAWWLFNRAAHLMDSVEDGDEPEEWWASLGPGAAINVASGLFFSAAQLLGCLSNEDLPENTAIQVSEDFYRSFLVMSSGQHQDLINPYPGLEKYWQIAEAKSGSFFALACRAGARLATQDPKILEAFSTFGLHLGLIVQILDDLEDFRSGDGENIVAHFAEKNYSLPVVYALEMYPSSQRSRLKAALGAAVGDAEEARIAWDLIEQSGAALYLLAELENHQKMALAALEGIVPESPELVHLMTLIKQTSF